MGWFNKKEKKEKKVKKEKKQKQNYKIGIAFGGGATRGFAHLGVLKALEENGITFDEVAGTSVGSLIGALYSYGMTADEMIETARALKVKDIKTNIIPFKRSKTEGLQETLKKIIGDINIEDLKLPFTAVAVDLFTGREIHLDTGNVAEAVAGSCAHPVVYYPVDYGPYRLIDGGAKNNIPADVLKTKNCKYVISVDVNPTRGSGTNSTDYLPVLAASADIAMAGNAVKGELFSDILIKVNVKKFKATKLEGADEMIEIGYEEALKFIPQIKELLGHNRSKGFLFGLFKRTSKYLKQQKKEQKDIKKEVEEQE